MNKSNLDNSAVGEKIFSREVYTVFDKRHDYVGK
jgi:hypothetical protein